MDKETKIDVLVISPERLIFQGKSSSVILPGEGGVFEILPHHKRILSRLLEGYVVIDGQGLHIRRGVVNVGLNQLTAIVEE